MADYIRRAGVHLPADWLWKYTQQPYVMSDHFTVPAMVIRMWKSGSEEGMGQDFIGLHFKLSCLYFTQIYFAAT